MSLKKIKNMTQRIVVLYDGDSAGREAAKRAMVMGLEQGIERVADGSHTGCKAGGGFCAF